MKFDLDPRELDPWAGLLRRAGDAAAVGGRAVVAKGSLNIKNDARDHAPSGGHAKYYPASISYDFTTDGPDTFETETGPVEGRKQRGLGNLLEYGGPHNQPHPHLEPALDHEEPRFYAAAEDLAADLVERFSL